MRPNQNNQKLETADAEFARRVSAARREGKMFVTILTNTGYFRNRAPAVAK